MNTNPNIPVKANRENPIKLIFKENKIILGAVCF